MFIELLTSTTSTASTLEAEGEAAFAICGRHAKIEVMIIVHMIPMTKNHFLSLLNIACTPLPVNSHSKLQLYSPTIKL